MMCYIPLLQNALLLTIMVGWEMSVIIRVLARLESAFVMN